MNQFMTMRERMAREEPERMVRIGDSVRVPFDLMAEGEAPTRLAEIVGEDGTFRGTIWGIYSNKNPDLNFLEICVHVPSGTDAEEYILKTSWGDVL